MKTLKPLTIEEQTKIQEQFFKSKIGMSWVYQINY